MSIHDFVFWGDYNGRIDKLASLSPEKWSSGDKTDKSILKNYINYTFLKLEEENKIVETEKYALFNTGLFTEYYEYIYCYMEKNRSEGKQPWYAKDFLTEYELGTLGISGLPDRADYFQDPSLLVFDANCKINVQYKHIFNDEENLKRLPGALRENKMLPVIFEGAVERMKKRVVANYKIAVPQYYNHTIQLLLPLSLQEEDKPDLALVVTKNKSGNFYQGHTCLSLEMAYNNARLIAKPNSNWLEP